MNLRSTFPGIDTADGAGAPGAAGQSAYQLWLSLGNSGTPSDFLTALRGAPGVDGTDGTDGANGAPGSLVGMVVIKAPTTSWVVPAGVSRVLMKVTGPGGGGAAGHCGGCGGYAEFQLAVTPLETLTVAPMVGATAGNAAGSTVIKRGTTTLATVYGGGAASSSSDGSGGYSVLNGAITGALQVAGRNGSGLLPADTTTGIPGEGGHGAAAGGDSIVVIYY